MAPVQSKLVAHGKQYQSTLIPVVASTPHGPANFMSLGRIVAVHHDTSQHFHLQGSNFSGATGVNIGSGTNNTSKTWCVCEMPEEDYNEEEMNMVSVSGRNFGFI